MNAHKPFSFCGYSFQNELGIQRDGSSFGPGSSNRGGERPVGRGFQRGQRSLGSGFQRRRRCLGRKNPMKPEVSWHTILLARSSVFMPLATVGGGKGLFGAGTGTFRQPQNRRILVRHALKFRICPEAKFACSGVGGAAKWGGEAQGRLAMERHHRGSQRYIIPRPAAATPPSSLWKCNRLLFRELIQIGV